MQQLQEALEEENKLRRESKLAVGLFDSLLRSNSSRFNSPNMKFKVDNSPGKSKDLNGESRGDSDEISKISGVSTSPLQDRAKVERVASEHRNAERSPSWTHSISQKTKQQNSQQKSPSDEKLKQLRQHYLTQIQSLKDVITSKEQRIKAAKSLEMDQVQELTAKLHMATFKIQRLTVENEQMKRFRTRETHVETSELAIQTEKDAHNAQGACVQQTQNGDSKTVKQVLEKLYEGTNLMNDALDLVPAHLKKQLASQSKFQFITEAFEQLQMSVGILTSEIRLLETRKKSILEDVEKCQNAHDALVREINRKRRELQGMMHTGNGRERECIDGTAALENGKDATLQSQGSPTDEKNDNAIRITEQHSAMEYQKNAPSETRQKLIKLQQMKKKVGLLQEYLLAGE